MNPRILELAEQAGSTHKQNLGVYQFYTNELEKFTELLIRECIEVVKDSEGYSQYFPHVARNIKKHFGVKQ